MAESVCGGRKPYSGVIIKASRGGYPAWECFGLGCDFFRSRKQCCPGSLVTGVYGFTSIKYNLIISTALTYAITSLGEIYSPVYDPSTVKYAVCATNGPAVITITGTQNYVIPEGYTQADIFCVGGGGGGVLDTGLRVLPMSRWRRRWRWVHRHRS